MGLMEVTVTENSRVLVLIIFIVNIRITVYVSPLYLFQAKYIKVRELTL